MPWRLLEPRSPGATGNQRTEEMRLRPAQARCWAPIGRSPSSDELVLYRSYIRVAPRRIVMSRPPTAPERESEGDSVRQDCKRATGHSSPGETRRARMLCDT